MSQTTPAIVTQGAVKRLPRLALWLFCAAYVLPGFLGRGPWKRADITTFGYMAELANGTSNWWQPTLGGLHSEVNALLPYWLGAWAMRAAPDWLPLDLAARLPFMGMLIMTLVCTWYGSYYLARHPQAQPVAFAFGGEARPVDYARAIADGGVLALIACLGLAQLAHETTPALAQLCFTSLIFYAACALPYRVGVPSMCACLGLVGLTLSGAPTMAVGLGGGCALLYLMQTSRNDDALALALQKGLATGLLGITLVCVVLATQLELWGWRIALPHANWQEWQSLGRLFLWFTWPTWPLALWTLWRWRHQLLRARVTSVHLWLPIWFVVVACIATLTTAAADRSLLLALPALAALGAFSLPTLGRSFGSLIDWFTLIFFSGCALVIWVVWISLQTGLPAQPAMNVARLAPGFAHSFSYTAFSVALVATFTWAWLVKWRVGRHRAAIWKSVVLPAGGAALCWLLLMTLWLPLLDFARSYRPLVNSAVAMMPAKPACVSTLGLSRSHIAAFQFHGQLTLTPFVPSAACPWLITDDAALQTPVGQTINGAWRLHGRVGHPADPAEQLSLFSRQVR